MDFVLIVTGADGEVRVLAGIKELAVTGDESVFVNVTHMERRRARVVRDMTCSARFPRDGWNHGL